ncbi:unnamed protein product [Sphagnum jensenii]
MQVSPSQLSTLLHSAIPAHKNVLVTGQPGIGKTDIISQAVAYLGWDFIVSHPVTSDPTDAKGMPWIYQTADGPRANFIPLAEMEMIYSATTPTVWMIDDIGQSTPATQASYMGKLHPPTFNGKRIAVNGYCIPDCVTILAATNGRGDRAGVSGILEPVKSRFHTIVDLVPAVDDFCNWTFAHNIPATLPAFIRFRPDLLCNFKPTADMSNSPNPRTWVNMIGWESLALPQHVELAAMSGAVGDGPAAEYLAFRKMFRSLTSIDALLADPNGTKLPTEPNELYAVCTALASKATEQNISRIGTIVQRLMDAGRGEFSALTLKDAVRRNPKIAYADGYIRIACSPIGQLITGNGE